MPAEIGLALVTTELAEAVMFGPEGLMAAPTEMIRKRPVIVVRGMFSHISKRNVDMLTTARAALDREALEQEREPLLLMELSVNSPRERDLLEPDEYLRRLRDIRSAGQWVLLSRIGASHELTTYLRRYSQAPIRFSMGVSTLAMLFAEEYYAELAGGLLEAIGRLFSDNVKVYVHDMDASAFKTHLASFSTDTSVVLVSDDAHVSIDNLRFKPPFNSLFQFLSESGLVVSVH